jgi:DNA-binding XRE family transcriptional regulator
MVKSRLTLAGEEYVILSAADYDRMVLLAKAGEVGAASLNEDVPAIPFARASIARDLIRQRLEVGITQTELARRAGIRTETLCRLEAGRHTPTIATIDRLHKALKEAAADKPLSAPASRKRRTGKRSAKA